MKTLIVVLAAGALLSSAAIAPALAQGPAASASAKLTTTSSMKDLLANAKAKDVLAKYAPQVVEFFASGQAESVIPGDTPLATLAENDQAQAAGLTPENMKKIDEDLSKL